MFLNGLAGFANVEKFIKLSVFARVEKVGAVEYLIKHLPPK